MTSSLAGEPLAGEREGARRQAWEDDTAGMAATFPFLRVPRAAAVLPRRRWCRAPREHLAGVRGDGRPGLRVPRDRHGRHQGRRAADLPRHVARRAHRHEGLDPRPHVCGGQRGPGRWARSRSPASTRSSAAGPTLRINIEPKSDEAVDPLIKLIQRHEQPRPGLRRLVQRPADPPHAGGARPGAVHVGRAGPGRAGCAWAAGTSRSSTAS